MMVHFCKRKKVIFFFNFHFWHVGVGPLLKICLFQGEQIVVETKLNTPHTNVFDIANTSLILVFS